MASVVQSLEVSYFVQLTEDEEKVRTAVAHLLGADFPEERQEAEGHFGNKIVWVRRHIVGDDAAAALREVVSHIAKDERKAIVGDLGAVLDEHNALYIRLSKQVLVMRGDAVLTRSDPIRIKVKPRSYMVQGDPARLYAMLLEVAS